MNSLVIALYRSRIGATKSIVVGSGNAEDSFIKELSSHPSHGREVLAIFDGSVSINELDEFADSTLVEEIIIDCPKLPEAKLLSFLNWAEDRGAAFVLVPSVLSVRATNVEVGTLAGTPVMYFLRTPLQGWQRAYKRILDLLIIVPAIIILSPVYLIIAILVKISSPGPIIYSHKRVGQDGRLINIHKFRSMYVNAEHKLKITWSMDESSDPRITPIGRILRKTNLDELPQLWDILIGRMSIVGPRPEQPQYVEKFSHEIPDYIKRHHIKTGLTGWAQVNGLRGDTSVAERVKYDLYYIQNWSIWFDIRIIIATVIMIFRQLLGSD